MKNKLLVELQGYHYSLRDVNGHWRKEPIGFIGDAKTSENNILVLRSIINTVIDSDEIHAETKVFIASKGITIKGVNEIVNNARACKVDNKGNTLRRLSYANTCQRLQEDNNLLESYLGDGVLRGIAYDTIQDSKEIRKKLKKFRERLGDSISYKENLLISIDSKYPKVTSYANNEEFFEILNSIEAYLIQRKKIIEVALNENKEFADYFNYLLSKKSIDNDDLRLDRERLIKFLRNEDYITGYDEHTDDTDNTDEDFDITKEYKDLKTVSQDNVELTESGELKMRNYTAINYDSQGDTDKDDDEDLKIVIDPNSVLKM